MMANLEKKVVSLEELKGIIFETLRGKHRLEQITWFIVPHGNQTRGENFSIEIQNDGGVIPVAETEAKEIFFKIQGTYQLAL